MQIISKYQKVAAAMIVHQSSDCNVNNSKEINAFTEEIMKKDY